MKLLIISDMAHHLLDGRVFGWGPAVREIDHLAEVFHEVRHLAVRRQGPPPPAALPYSSPKIHFVPLTPATGGGFGVKLNVLRRSPEYVKACLRELRWADAVHVRCPASVSLQALLLLRFRKRPMLRWAKYAGNWRPQRAARRGDGREPFFYRLQRQWLARGIHKGLVTCNGEWPNQPAHVFSLHNPCLTEAELTHARTATRHKQPGDPLRLLFAGQLRPSKGPDRALRILAGLRDRGWNARLDLAGDGPRARQLHELAGCLGLSRHVTFHGWVSVSALHELYRDAHFFLLPSSTEGWPKVVGEAMAFRAVPLAGAVSCIAQVLDATGAGVALPPDGVGAFAASIDSLARNPAAWLRMAANGQKAAIDFTYEAYVERVRRLLRIEPACQTGAQVQAVRGTAAG